MIQILRQMIIGTSVILSCISAAPQSEPVVIFGRMCAYDPTYDILRDNMDTDHIEVVIIDTKAKSPNRFLKVEVLAFRKDPLPVEVFDGRHDITLKVSRSEKCDENSPSFLKPGEFPKRSGKYLPTKAYDLHDLKHITHLPCFIARTDN